MEIEENKWGIVRTNNGEWISEIHNEVLDEDELVVFEHLASKDGRKLDKHYCYYEETDEKFVWCYKNDINELLDNQ